MIPVLGSLPNSSPPRRRVTRTVMLTNPPLNFATSHPPPSEAEIGFGVESGGDSEDIVQGTSLQEAFKIE